MMTKKVVIWLLLLLTVSLEQVDGGRQGGALPWVQNRRGRQHSPRTRQGKRTQFASAQRQSLNFNNQNSKYLDDVRTTRFADEVVGKEAEFVAGSFILTQRALDEAPYRYSSFLTQALEVMEVKDPPTKSDEENCSVRYRIEPSGRRSEINVIEDSLRVKLLENNTVTISAVIDVKVPARTWIWKGINFGFLGCMKISSCGGQIVTYGAHIDMELALQVMWDSRKKKISVFIKPVETVLSNVRVEGCRPPWYLWWFKAWQEMLNTGVQQAFQEFADSYSHSLTIPTEMTVHKNIFISYKVTNLIWSKDFVAFEATSTFKALVENKNITFIPNQELDGINGKSSIPIGQWPQSSMSDQQSHLLQGVRLSGYFLNSIMWYASITNVTEYRSNTTVLDSQINGTISYTPPILTVEEEGVLNITIPQGKLLAVCRPIKEANAATAVLFKAEFTDLAGSGSVKLAAGNKTGIIIEIQSLDLSHLKTKPFEPKLPLPETFESELMKTGIAQLRPIINQYLQDKPIYLPENISPLVAYPEVFLNQTRSGLGYAQILSYCTCSDFQAPGAFSKCDARSGLCKPKVYNKRRRRNANTKSSGALPPPHKRGPDFKAGIPANSTYEELPEFATFLNKSSTFHKVIDVANDFIENHFLANKSKDGSPVGTLPDQDGELQDPQMIISRGPTSTLGVNPVYLVQYETSVNCSLHRLGDNAKTYKLTPKPYCSPITAGNQASETNQYYVFKPDGSRILFGCFDKFCKTCSYNVDISAKDVCIPATNHGQSFVVSASADTTQEVVSTNNGTLSMAVFFNKDRSCQLNLEDDDREEAVMIASTYELGLENQGCQEMQSGGYLQIEQTGPNRTLSRIKLECDQGCIHCGFDILGIRPGDCQLLRRSSKVMLARAQLQIPSYILQDQEEEEVILTVILAASLSVALVFSIIVGVAAIWCCKTQKSGEKRFNKYRTLMVAGLASATAGFKKTLHRTFSKHLGVRFKLWATEEKKEIFEDVVQNLLLLANGICAILFAFEWNSPNNPLYLFTTKLNSKAGLDSGILEMGDVIEFATKLNFWTYVCNIVNGIIAFLIILAWIITKTGAREAWTKARLLSSTMMLTSILLTIACLIFTTYFDDLVKLKYNSGYFITDNIKMRTITETIVQISLNGLSLTVISFTIVFLFHGVGGGLFSGTVLFRILHLYSKKDNLEILTTLLVILTIIQPFICLHPVIIWSQDSSSNAVYLVLTIFIWFLPLAVHLFIKVIVTQINNRYINRAPSANSTSPAELTPLNSTKMGKPKPSLKVTQSAPANRKEASTTTTKISPKIITIVDVGMQVTQLLLFLSAFSFITHYIINTELDSQKSNLKHFVLPAIISVFFWMMSIAYYLLDLTMNASKDTTPLVFKDQALSRARQELQGSLRRRLAALDKRQTLGVTNRIGAVTRPRVPPPPPPSKPGVPSTRHQWKSKSLPPGKMKERREAAKSGDSIKIKIKEIKKLDDEEVSSTSVTNSETSQTIVKTSPTSSNNKLNKTKFTKSSTVESLDMEEDVSVRSEGWCSTILDYILERTEYAFPENHGWRIKFRRIFLHLGVFGFSYTTFETLISTENYSSKKEIQKVLDYVGTNLTWPDEGSALDDVFALYNTTQQRKSYVMIAACVLFWSSLVFDTVSYWTSRKQYKDIAVVASRVVNFLGSLLVFASVILVGLPDYLEASHLDEICPYCGKDFNVTVKHVAEFSIGLFFASLFTFQLLPVLMTIAPALVRASVLILIHPGLRSPDKTTVLRMSILQKVIVVSSLLSFPITFVSMCIVNQHQQDVVVTILIILYWTLPPLTLYIGLHYARAYQKYTILLFVYYTYNCVYIGLVSALLLYSFQLEHFLKILQDMLVSPSVWFGTMAQVFLCNVVISDLLYMTVF